MMSFSSFLAQNPPKTYTDVLHAYQHFYDHLISTGQAQPFVYPYRAFGIHLFIAYLLIPPINPRTSPALASLVHWARYPVFLVASWWCVKAMVECRSPLVTMGYGVGLTQSWSVLWMASLSVFMDGRQARRIESCKDRMREGEDIIAKSSGVVLEGDAHRRLNNTVQNGGPSKEEQERMGSEESKTIDMKWQGLPEGLWHRIDWVSDLFISFRGIRWSHQVPSLPFPNASSLQAFAEPISRQSSATNAAGPNRSKSAAYPTRSVLLRANIKSFIINLIVLDILKYLILQDPYYWGVPNPGPSPFPYPHAFRLLLSLASVYSFLWSIFLLSPLVYCGLLGERVLGEHAWPWLYPPYNGSLHQIWRKGLAGVWAEWWHQIFRHGFEQAGEFVGWILGWKKRTTKGMLLRLIVAFVCSGCLHACGSYTALGDTRPSKAFIFFAIQPIGIILQRIAAKWIKMVGLRDRISSSVCGAGNLSFVLIWFWFTGPPIADEFAKAVIWLDEPIPISLMRGLQGEGWWFWGGTWVRWHKADKWWQSGLAF